MRGFGPHRGQAPRILPLGDPLVAAAVRALRGERGPVYAVGGVLRDAILRPGTPVADLDLAVSGSPKALAARLARELGGTAFVLHARPGEQVARVVPKPRPELPAGCRIDIAKIQGKNIVSDLGRRDFTVNAVAEDLSGTDPAIDPFGGLADLEKRVLRAVSAKNLADDPLRVLRAFRIAAQFGLKIDAKTFSWLKAKRAGLSRCAGERIREELMKLLSVPDAAPWLKRMDDARVLTAVIPDLEPSRRCAVGYYGPGGVLKHTLAVVERMDLLLGGLEELLPSLAGPVRYNLNECPGGEAGHPALLRLACLMHDVSKPECAKMIDGRLRFYEHDLKGAKRAAKILKALRFSAAETDWVARLTRHHLRPGNLAANRRISDKAVFRFFRDLEGAGVSMLLLCWADHASYVSPRVLDRLTPHLTEHPETFEPSGIRGEDTRKSLFHLQVVAHLLDQWVNRPETSRPKRVLDGNAVMAALKIPAGPRVGEVLRAVREAQAEGVVKTKDDAMRFIKKVFKK